MQVDQAEEILNDLRQIDREKAAAFSIEGLPAVRDVVKPLACLIEGLIAEATVNLVSGASNDGKSYF